MSNTPSHMRGSIWRQHEYECMRKQGRSIWAVRIIKTREFVKVIFGMLSVILVFLMFGMGLTGTTPW